MNLLEQAQKQRPESQFISKPLQQSRFMKSHSTARDDVGRLVAARPERDVRGPRGDPVPPRSGRVVGGVVHLAAAADGQRAQRVHPALRHEREDALRACGARQESVLFSV